MVTSVGNEVVVDGGRRYDVIGSNDADRHDVISVCYDRRASHGNHRIEVAGGQGIREIPDVVREEGVHQSEVRAKRGFNEVWFAVNFYALLVLFDNGAEAGGRQHSTEPAAASANSLDQCALR